MKKLQILTTFYVVFSFYMNAQVGIGTTSPDTSALLDLNSSSKGFLVPRLTSVERDQINYGNIAEGLIIYNLDSKMLEIFDGNDWNRIVMEKLITEKPSKELLNGDFENWMRDKLDDWTIIEEGIKVEKDSVIIKAGKKSAKIQLNTTQQDTTDLRQRIQLEKGTYEISFYVFHLDKTSRVRLYADSFKNYSDSSIINEWQEVRSTFTLNNTQEIEIGFRFYDTDEFIDSSRLYLDHVQLIKK
ncbi:hypothetical protein UJ101_00447 [Flavobacteriaceae bacterium UJ101]|nr:hypothetical protein UJ101_00447 [Flavobacteriaceae bacterium UJ101]